jgi:hypothetical protein
MSPLRLSYAKGDAPVRQPEDARRLASLLHTRTRRQWLQKALTNGQPIENRSLSQADRERFEFAASLGLLLREGNAFGRRPAGVDNIGPLLEWYVHHLCETELDGSAAWSVEVEDLAVGGDFDVLAWLAPALVYIEVKSGKAGNDTVRELQHFLQRYIELRPDIAVLLIDSNDTAKYLECLGAAIQPILDALGGPPGQPASRHRSELHEGVHFMWPGVIISGSEPSLRTQVRRCMRHFHVIAKPRMMSWFDGSPHGLDFVAGRVGLL